MLKQNAYYFIIALLVCSVIIYAMSFNYKLHYTEELINKRDAKREFVINLSGELKRKAGVVISKNNFDPVLPNTLLRIMLRTPQNSIASYRYDSSLILVPVSAGNVIDIRDIVQYAPVRKEEGNWIVTLQ